MDDDAPLLRAMPRGPLYALKGFITRVDLALLTTIDEDGWFATRAAIEADVDSKEVRLVVAILCGTDVLVGPGGRFGFSSDIGPECEGLAALKNLAKATAERTCGHPVQGVELAGYLNDDLEATLRHVFVLVYRARVPAGTAAPDGMSWVGKPALPKTEDPISARISSLMA